VHAVRLCCGLDSDSESGTFGRAEVVLDDGCDFALVPPVE